MDKSTENGVKKEARREVDLSGLQDFNFASNWSENQSGPVERDRDRPERSGHRRDRQPDRRTSGGGRGRSSADDTGRPRRPRRSDRSITDVDRRQNDPSETPSLRDCPFDIQVSPEEAIITTMIRAMRQSLRTYELFEIGRLVLEKPDRFHIIIRFKDQDDGSLTFYESVPDGLPFTSEESAIEHVFRNRLESFFSMEEIEVDPPKGNFVFIARCTLTGEFLSPPNYHRYQQILRQYYEERFSDMSFEHFRSRIETVKDEEAIQKWLQAMTKQKRYKLLEAAGGEERVFETAEEARAYLIQNQKKRIVRPLKSVRVPGKMIEAVSDPQIRHFLQAYVEQQRRFPLETTNALRGRFRRQRFFIYKKGARGISHICPVKRKFREPGQFFSETIEALLAFIEANDEILASRLPKEFLGIDPAPESERSPETEEGLKRLNLDLRWLLAEGYVTEYSDGRLSVHEPVAAADDAKETEEPARPTEPVEQKSQSEEKAAARIEAESVEPGSPEEASQEELPAEN